MKFYLSTLIIFLSFIVKIEYYANASTSKTQKCSLQPNEALVVGCTQECGRFNTRALKRYAKKLGYKIKLVNLYSENQSPDLTKVDAVLIPGGADIDPKYYIDTVEEDMKQHIRSLDHLVEYTEEGKRRDPFEYKLVQDYFKSKDPSINKTPILGICRGMQMLTVSQGIPLFIDIKEEIGIPNRRWKLDKIKVKNKNSLIFDIQKRSKFKAVELHHQGLRLDYYNKHKTRWPGVEVTGVSNKNRIAEVLEFDNRPVLGVQFHPEYTFGRTRKRIFSWLLNRACIKKKLTRKNK